MDIFTSPLRGLGKYPILATSTSVNNCYIVRDSEPIRLLKSPRSLSVYILNIFITSYKRNDKKKMKMRICTDKVVDQMKIIK